MKKLIAPCLLVISLMTATAAQLTTSTLVSINDIITKGELKDSIIVYVEIAEEEEDEAFDFDINAYLPVGFNANTSLEYDVVLEEEEDAPFDFNTKDYLPIGFGLKKSVLDSIEEIVIEEEEAPFDFNTKSYLPKGFKATKETTIINNEI